MDFLHVRTMNTALLHKVLKMLGFFFLPGCNTQDSGCHWGNCWFFLGTDHLAKTKLRG